MVKWSDFKQGNRRLPLAALAIALATVPQAALAQQGLGQGGGQGGGQGSDQGGGQGGGASVPANRRSVVIPYLEVGQLVSADLKNGGDLLTYSLAAVGVDAALQQLRELRVDGWPCLSIHGDKSQEERDWVLQVRQGAVIA